MPADRAPGMGSDATPDARTPDARTPDAKTPDGRTPGTKTPDPVGEPSRWRRLAPVLALLVLAPWAAECSWGGFTALGFLPVVIFLGPLYGGAAVLIREVARRTGAGWPAIVLLAAAFGVYQAGLVDQSLFNTGYLDDTEFADWAAETKETSVPGLGFSAATALAYVGNHIALSICAPIAIVESFLGPRRRLKPWLGGRGLVVVGVVFVLGSLLIFSDDSGRKGFLADPLQLSVAALTVLALIGAAALPRWRRLRRPTAGSVPHPVWAGLMVFGVHFTAGWVPGWAGVGIQLTAIAMAAAVIIAWSRRTGWDQRHVLAAWAGGLASAATGAYLAPSYQPASAAEALISDIAVTVVALALVGGAYRRLRRQNRPATTHPRTPRHTQTRRS